MIPFKYPFGSNTDLGSKIKTTRTYLEMFLAMLKERRPCNVGYASNTILWAIRKELNQTNPQDNNDKKSSRIYCNALQRINDAYWFHNRDVPFNQLPLEVAMLTIDQYINLVEAAIELPREYCRDGATT